MPQESASPARPVAGVVEVVWVLQLRLGVRHGARVVHKADVQLGLVGKEVPRAQGFSQALLHLQARHGAPKPLAQILTRACEASKVPCSSDTGGSHVLAWQTRHRAPAGFRSQDLLRSPAGWPSMGNMTSRSAPRDQQDEARTHLVEDGVVAGAVVHDQDPHTLVQGLGGVQRQLLHQRA